MSMGEKLVEKAWESMEADMRDKQSCRRDFFHAVIVASVVCVGICGAIVGTVNHSSLADAFEGGKMAKQALPVITADIASIRLDVARIAGAVDALSNNKVRVMVTASNEDARVVK